MLEAFNTFSDKWMTKLSKLGSSSSIGDVRHSMLTLAQFQQENGSTWVLCDGADVSGSKLATLTGNSTLPDARGQFLRGKNNGRSDGQENPDGDVAIGIQQGMMTQSHSHTMGAAHTDTGNGAGYGLLNVNTFPIHTQPYNMTLTGQTSGPETRPRNITVNIFIKIN